MEVHHHPKVEKKKFKEYFLEFIMIFLAVTLGFFAENIRERITEHERAKIYAGTMVSDLGADTAALKSYISYWNYAANNVDTLFQLLSVHQPKEIPSGKLYWYGLFGGAPTVFVPNDATLQQMKSGGTLRYFSNNLMQKVAQYDQMIRRMKIYDDQDERIWTEVRKVRSQIFFVQFNEAANDIYQSNKFSPVQKRIDSFIQTKPPLLSDDQAMFNQYLELVRSRFMHSKVRRADTLLVRATALIHDLKKEYHLKNE
jgi:hypothetical protein